MIAYDRPHPSPMKSGARHVLFTVGSRVSLTLGGRSSTTFPATAEREAFWLEAGARLDEPSRRALADLARGGVVACDLERGGPFGLAADGWLGQQLIVVPSLGIVAVRQHEAPEGVVADDA